MAFSIDWGSLLPQAVKPDSSTMILSITVVLRYFPLIIYLLSPVN